VQPLFLRDHSDETISEWYLRAFEILNRAKELPVDDDGNLMPGGLCKMYREAMLADLLRTICPGKEFIPRRSDLYSGDGSPTVSFADVRAALFSRLLSFLRRSSLRFFLFLFFG
jgi:hypothetical protein